MGDDPKSTIQGEGTSASPPLPQAVESCSPDSVLNNLGPEGVSVQACCPSKRPRVQPTVTAALVGTAVGICGIAFRMFEFRMYSPLPTGFDGPLFYRQQYLLDHHQFVSAFFPTYSYWSGGVRMQLGIYLQEVIYAAVLQMSRWTGVSTTLIHQIILTSSLIPLACILLMYGRVKRPPLVYVAIVSLLVTIGTPVVINYLTGWDAAYGWVLFMGVTVVALSNLPVRWKLAATLILTIIGPPIYHTGGFYLIVYVVALWFSARMVNLRYLVASPIPVFVCYFTYQSYVSIQTYHEFSKGIMDVLTFQFLHREATRIGFTVEGPKIGIIELRYLHLFLWILLSIPIIIAVLRYAQCVMHKRKKVSHYGEFGSNAETDSDALKYITAVVAATIAVAAVGGGFGIRTSITQLINRGAEYLILPATIAIIIELRHRSRYHRYIYPLVATIFLISVYSFVVQSTTVYATNHLTWPEAQGYEWIKQRLHVEDVVFTDFRLSAPFIVDGHFRTIGVTGQPPENTQRLLSDIYYGNSPSSITQGIDAIRTYGEARTANYIFLSVQMTKVFPGLVGFEGHFPAVPLRFFRLLDHSLDWKRIYGNMQIRIYERRLSLTIGDQQHNK